MDEIRQSLASIGGVDALRRLLPMAKEVGPLRKNRYVGMFYFLWHGEHATDGPYDITEILKNILMPQKIMIILHGEEKGTFIIGGNRCLDIIF